MRTDLLCLEYGAAVIMKAIYSLKKTSSYIFLSQNPFRAVLSEVEAVPVFVVFTKLLILIYERSLYA
jgi:hypothetical protein